MAFARTGVAATPPKARRARVMVRSGSRSTTKAPATMEMSISRRLLTLKLSARR